MALVTKNDVTQIFAIQAPEVDLPPTFANYPRGWDTARSNNGKPTIKQFNYIQQRTDQNVLWIHQNGAALPYDATMEYAEGAVVVKDGELKQLVGGAWVEVKTKATAITTASTQNQQQINDFGGAKWYAKADGYALGATVKLGNGDSVKSAIPNNTNNPNENMTGWKPLPNISDLVYTIDSFSSYAIGGDWSLAFKAMFDLAREIHPRNIVFVGRPDAEYLLKTKTAGSSVFDISGNASIHGMGCKLKLADGFGDFFALFNQPPQDGWQSGEYWEIKNLIIDYNTTNNLKTNTNANNRRAAFFLWNSLNGKSDVKNLYIKDFLGVWFVTQGNNKGANISDNRVEYTNTTAPWEDRTVVYTGSQSAYISNNFFLGNGELCDGGIEAHGSNQFITNNFLSGIKIAFHVMADAGIGGAFLNPAQNIKVVNNTVDDCGQFVRLWVTPAIGLNGVTISNNLVTLDTKCGTDVVQDISPVAIACASLESTVENLTISGNTITRNLNTEDLTKDGRCIFFYGGYSAPAKSFKNLFIDNNTFVNSLHELVRFDYGSQQDVDSGLINASFSGNKFINCFNYTGETPYSAFNFSSVFKYEGVSIRDNYIESSFNNYAMTSLLETTAFNINPTNDSLSGNLFFSAHVDFGNGKVAPRLIKTHKPVLCDVVIKDYLKLIPQTSLILTGSKFTDLQNGRVMTCVDSTNANKIKFDLIATTTGATVPAGDYSEGCFVRNTRKLSVDFGFIALYGGAISSYDWSASKVVNRGDYVKIGSSIYVAANSGTLSVTQPTAGNTNIKDGDVDLIYAINNLATFNSLAKVKTAAAVSDNTVALSISASLEDVIAAVNTLASQDNTIKSRLRGANVIKV